MQIGALRFCDANRTLQRLELILSKIGISRVANISGLDTIGLPVYTCIRPDAKHLSTSQGKGVNHDLAKISAIMEACEAFHLENPPPHAVEGSFEGLKQRYPLMEDPNQCISHFFQLDLKKTSLKWIQAYDLLQSKNIYIPYGLICVDTTCLRPDSMLFTVSTNGIAAGNTEDEALCHALYEIIERDALIQWQKDPTKGSLIELDSSVAAYNQETFDKMKPVVDIKIWNITSAMGIPVFHVAIQGKSIRGLGVFTGTGCHFDKNIALSRALTEACQARLVYISGSRDDIFADAYQRKLSHTWSEPTKTQKLFLECEQPVFNQDFEKTVADILARIKKAGYEKIWMLNHTKPEMKIPVIQAFVPGMYYEGNRM